MRPTRQNTQFFKLVGDPPAKRNIFPEKEKQPVNLPKEPVPDQETEEAPQRGNNHG